MLREASFSPVMADWLTYLENKALSAGGNVPDENYAREIMQLFSIGLYALRGDGTLQIGTLAEPKRKLTLDLRSENNPSISHIHLSTDERWLVLGSLRGVVQLIDMETLALVRTGVTHMGSIQGLSLSADNQFLAIAGERGGVRIWHQKYG